MEEIQSDVKEEATILVADLKTTFNRNAERVKSLFSEASEKIENQVKEVKAEVKKAASKKPAVKKPAPKAAAPKPVKQPAAKAIKQPVTKPVTMPEPVILEVMPESEMIIVETVVEENPSNNDAA